MDEAIKSKSNKDVAKKHIDLVGSYIQSSYKITNKGVHSDLTRLEAVKSVMHIYLVCADLLSYLDRNISGPSILNIHFASLDEIESICDIPRKFAKEIIKARVLNKVLTKEIIKKIPGVGQKTLDKICERMSIDAI